MDIELAAVILEDGPRHVEDWSVVDDSSLHYDHFIGEVSFRIGDADFSPVGWTWVPVFDFAAALRAVVAALEPGAEETFEYTENEHLIRFRRTDDLVTVSTSYVDATASVPHAELLDAAEAFLNDLGHVLLRAHPALGSNAHFAAAAFPDE